MLMGGGYRAEGNKGEKKWDNCNSIINKIYLKKKKKSKRAKKEERGRQTHIRTQCKSLRY